MNTDSPNATLVESYFELVASLSAENSYEMRWLLGRKANLRPQAYVTNQVSDVSPGTNDTQRIKAPNFSFPALHS
jgi:hypothetical protein